MTFCCVWSNTHTIHTFSAHLMKRAWEPRPHVTEHWMWNRAETESLFTLAKNTFKYCISAVLFILISYLLPCGDKPLDLALFLAASDEAGILTSRFWQACALAVGQRVCLGTRVRAHTQHSPLLQTIATLTRTLPNKNKHDIWLHLGIGAKLSLN